MADIDRGAADGGGSVQTVPGGRRCGFCGAVLTGVRRQRFCNDACRSAFHRRKRSDRLGRIVRGLKDGIAELADELGGGAIDRSLEDD